MLLCLWAPWVRKSGGTRDGLSLPRDASGLSWEDGWGHLDASHLSEVGRLLGPQLGLLAWALTWPLPGAWAANANVLRE